MASSQPRVTFIDGNSIPQVGLGVWQVPAEQTSDVCLEAIRAGYRHIDTASGYENEEGVGAAIAAAEVPREEMFIATKLRNGDQGYDSTLKAFEGSMSKLGLDVLDLYLIHWPMPGVGLFVDTWKAFVRLQEEGRVRSIGVSNFRQEDIDRIEAETGVTPVLNQIELHPLFQQKQIRPYLEGKGIKIESWSPLGSGGALGNQVLKDIAEKHGRTVAQVIIRWHIQSGFIVIPKSVTPERIRSNFQVFDFELEMDDMAAIATLDRAGGRIGPDPAAFELRF